MTQVVNPTFRIDVTGQLFKNKDSNINVQDTLVFNKLFTRLGIVKGDLATFPQVGLQQHLFVLSWGDHDELEERIRDFEEDVKIQMQQDCSIESEYNVHTKDVSLEFILANLKYTVEFIYQNLNKSIKIIDYQFSDRT